MARGTCGNGGGVALKYLVFLVLLLIPVQTSFFGRTEPDRMDLIRDVLQRLKNAQSELENLENEERYMDLPARCDGRLTTESGVPLSTSNRSSQGTIYFTPYHGSVVSLYNGTNWTGCSFTELSLSVGAISSGSNYDVFVYDTGSCSLALELSTAWSSDVGRFDSLTTVNGVYVKSGLTTRRYLGTIRGSGAGVTEDSSTKRFVWNHYNRLPRVLAVTESANSWAYATAAWRAYNNTTNNQVQFVLGENSVLTYVRAIALVSASAASVSSCSIGLDSSTVPSSLVLGGQRSNSNTISQEIAEYYGYPGLGYHYLQMMEYGTTSSGVFYGDNNNPSQMQAGMIGEVDG